MARFITSLVLLAVIAGVFAHRSYSHGVMSPVRDAGKDLCPQHIGAPCPYYATNNMPDYKPGTPVYIPDDVKAKFAELTEAYIGMIILNAPAGYNDTQGDEYDVYEGHAGHALVFLRMWKLEHDPARKQQNLEMAKTYIDHALNYVDDSPADSCSFQGSSVGTNAVAAIVYHLLGDAAASKSYVAAVQQRIDHHASCPDNSFVGGLAGLLYSGLLLNNVLPSAPIPRSSLIAVGQTLIDRGAVNGNHTKLVYLLGKTPFIGTGMGTSGVLHVLLELPELLKISRNEQLIKATLNDLLKQQLPDGNFPFPGEYNPQNTDVLVQWCEGGPGFISMLTKAAQVLKNTSYLMAAERVCDVTWTRGLLYKGMLLCHGVAGNAYTLLSHYRLTGSQQSLYRAIKFAEWTLDMDHVLSLRVPDEPFSMYAGSWAGAAFLYSDLLRDPLKSSQPAFDFDI